MMDNNLTCQFCGKPYLRATNFGYENGGIYVICEYSRCGAEWWGSGKLIKMPKGQRRKAVEK